MSSNNRNIANIDPSFLEEILKSSVKDSVKKSISHLITEKKEEEKKKQDSLSSKLDKQDLRAEQEAATKSDEEEKEDAPKKDSEEDGTKIKAQKLPESMEAEDVSRMLNIIRAGKSLKDPQVKERFDIWFTSLSPAEKVALKGFLDGMAQIITGDTEPDKASKPSNPPYSVKMTAGASEPKSRKPDAKDRKPPAEAEPSGVDSPIIVGESSDISEIKKRFFSSNL